MCSIHVIDCNKVVCSINFIVTSAPNQNHGHDKPEISKSCKSSQLTISSDVTLVPPAEVIQHYTS